MLNRWIGFCYIAVTILMDQIVILMTYLLVKVRQFDSRCRESNQGVGCRSWGTYVGL